MVQELNGKAMERMCVKRATEWRKKNEINLVAFCCESSRVRRYELWEKHWLILSFSTWNMCTLDGCTVLRWLTDLLRKPCMCNLPQNLQFTPENSIMYRRCFYHGFFHPSSLLHPSVSNTFSLGILFTICQASVRVACCVCAYDDSLAFCFVLFRNIGITESEICWKTPESKCKNDEHAMRERDWECVQKCENEEYKSEKMVKCLMLNILFSIQIESVWVANECEICVRFSIIFFFSHFLLGCSHLICLLVNGIPNHLFTVSCEKERKSFGININTHQVF